MTDFEALQARLGHRFSDPDLLETALTHRSHAAEQPATDNERMEFLGDAVLGLAVTGHLYRSHPNLSEGELAKARAVTVSREALAEVAVDLGLGPLIRLGKGEQATGGHEKDSILADAMEALLGAVHLDAGFDAAEAVTLRFFGPVADEMAVDPGARDFKTRVQERLAVDGLEASYEITADGPDHDRRFTATILAEGRPLGQGRGTSKKEAQQRAAREALRTLGPS